MFFSLRNFKSKTTVKIFNFQKISCYRFQKRPGMQFLKVRRVRKRFADKKSKNELEEIAESRLTLASRRSGAARPHLAGALSVPQNPWRSRALRATRSAHSDISANFRISH